LRKDNQEAKDHKKNDHRDHPPEFLLPEEMKEFNENDEFCQGPFSNRHGCLSHTEKS